MIKLYLNEINVVINTPTDRHIEQAATDHIPQIVSLANSYHLKDMMPNDATKFGFLVSSFTIEDYSNFLEQADYFYVVLDHGSILAFLLAYSSDRIKPDEWLNLLIKERYPNPFILIKQICVQREMSGKDLASDLYQHLIAQAPAIPFFTVIVEDPPNPRSVALHHKFDFTRVFSETPPGERPRNVWMRRP
jgi:predicted GNAT superfamily acetyltransferase